MKTNKKMRMARIGRKLAAVAAAMSLFMGMSATACAETVSFDFGTFAWRCIEDDGSVGTNKWAQNSDGKWIYFDANGIGITGELDSPVPLGLGPEGETFVDERVRSATGAPGQQPVLSVPSAQKDIRYKGLRQMLDSIPLYPDAKTEIPELDSMLDAVFAQIITPDMDTHDKLKACYDYLIMNMKDSRYEDTGENDMMIVFWGDEDGTTWSPVYGEAYGLLQSRVGVCDTFSATFAVMAWKLGVPMYVTGGYTSRSGGGYTPHTWCQLDGPDGTMYVFDPHIDYLLTLRGNGAMSNARFGPTRAQVAGKYIMDVIFDK
ncbi:MAG: transglutaminase domain-containing protein [Lachnospiraceae bacterium]|nr:transglutaminase domain-containing protein [Lachnospiraceae bacterium]